MDRGEPSHRTVESPFACPACGAGLGLPRHPIQVGSDRSPVGLRCHRCGHEWDLDRAAVADVARDLLPSDWRVPTTTVVRPIAACRRCAGLMMLDVALDLGRASCSSGYSCPHCGAAGEVTLPGADVRRVDAIGAPKPVAAAAS